MIENPIEYISFLRVLPNIFLCKITSLILNGFPSPIIDRKMAGYQEILLLVGLALLLFGPNKLPELARAFGKATSEYKKGITEAKKNIFEDADSNLSQEDQQLIKAAKDMGIPTEGRSVEEIANDIVNA